MRDGITEHLETQISFPLLARSMVLPISIWWQKMRIIQNEYELRTFYSNQRILPSLGIYINALPHFNFLVNIRYETTSPSALDDWRPHHTCAPIRESSHQFIGWAADGTGEKGWGLSWYSGRRSSVHQLVGHFVKRVLRSYQRPEQRYRFWSRNQHRH